MLFFVVLHTVGQNDALSLLSSLSRPADGTPAAQAANGGPAGKQLDLNNKTTTTRKTMSSKKAANTKITISKLTATTTNPPTKLSIISLADMPG
jgi:hypothetical protein